MSSLPHAKAFLARTALGLTLAFVAAQAAHAAPGTAAQRDPAALLAGEPAQGVPAQDVLPPPVASGSDALLQLLQERGALAAGAVSKGAEAVREGMASARDAASGLVVSALNFLGLPYVRGGTSAEGGFDCSGFTWYLYKNTLGHVLPRRADEQANAPGTVSVERTELKPGDLVFFNTLQRTFSHVGIYIGDGKFIHSPRSGSAVRIDQMAASYWAQRFTGARRLLALDSSTGPAPR